MKKQINNKRKKSIILGSVFGFIISLVVYLILLVYYIIVAGVSFIPFLLNNINEKTPMFYLFLIIVSLFFAFIGGLFVHLINLKEKIGYFQFGLYEGFTVGLLILVVNSYIITMFIGKPYNLFWIETGYLRSIIVIVIASLIGMSIAIFNRKKV